MARHHVNPSVPDSYRHAKDVSLNAVRDRLDAEGLTSADFKQQEEGHQGFASRLDEETEEARSSRPRCSTRPARSSPTRRQFV
jgi:hypothetical protein